MLWDFSFQMLVVLRYVAKLKSKHYYNKQTWRKALPIYHGDLCPHISAKPEMILYKLFEKAKKSGPVPHMQIAFQMKGRLAICCALVLWHVCMHKAYTDRSSNPHKIPFLMCTVGFHGRGRDFSKQQLFHICSWSRISGLRHVCSKFRNSLVKAMGYNPMYSYM